VVKESTALGAAMFAGVGAGVYRDIAEVAGRIVRLERTIDPDPAVRPAYDDAFARWSAVYPEVLGLAERRVLQPMWWPAGADAQEPVAAR
jgi:autoinducer 2 (AI-2) kinase